MNRKKITAMQLKNQYPRLMRALLFLAIVACYVGSSSFFGMGSTSNSVLASIRPQATPPKNVILLIGDGMSQAYVDAASIYAQGATGQLFMQSAPHQAFMSTDSLGGVVTDSAASGTAMATGHKVFNGVISMTAPEKGEALETSLEHYQNRCKSTGLVGTSYINHATASAFGAHAGSRTHIDDIAHDFFTETRPNVLFGGTASGIVPEAATENGYTVVSNHAQLKALVPAQNPYVSGQFGYGHMGYEYDDQLGGASFYAGMPHLSEMAKHALHLLEGNNDGFFLMIEGSRIDHAGHENNIRRAVFETLEFDKTVQEVVTWASTRNDTLIIVTADHDTGGLSIIENNGQGEFPTVRWTTFGHTATHVPVFAWGPGAELVSGQLDNTDIYRITTANSGEAADFCDAPGNHSDKPPEQGAVDTVATNSPTATPSPTPSPTPPPTLLPTLTPTPSPIPPFMMEINNSPREWVLPGGQITYVINYRIGEEKLEEVSLFSRMPDGVQLIHDSVLADNALTFTIETVDGVDTIEWRLGELRARGSGQASYRVRRLTESRNSDRGAGMGVGHRFAHADLAGQRELPGFGNLTALLGRIRDHGPGMFGANAISITKSGPETVETDEPITYTFTLTNISDRTLTDIFVVDAIPYGAAYLGGASALPINNEISWWIDQLAPQEIRTFSYSVLASSSLMTRGYKVFNSEGLGVSSYDVLSTIVNDTPLPFDGGGTEIVNNGVWATWYHRGQFNVGRAEPIINPMFDFYIPLLVQ